jgi:hypothetical protein
MRGSMIKAKLSAETMATFKKNEFTWRLIVNLTPPDVSDVERRFGSTTSVTASWPSRLFAISVLHMHP